MADWADPLLTTAYATFLAELKARDFDCATMFAAGTETNVETGSMRFNKTSNSFEHYSAGWQPQLLSVAGGGTGASTASAARTNLSALGTSDNAASATKLATSRLIGGTGFDGTANITPANCTTSAACSGLAATASAWATGRTITMTGDVSGTSPAWTGSGNLAFADTVVANDSHTHDTRYYTESEVDALIAAKISNTTLDFSVDSEITSGLAPIAKIGTMVFLGGFRIQQTTSDSSCIINDIIPEGYRPIEANLYFYGKAAPSVWVRIQITSGGSFFLNIYDNNWNAYNYINPDLPPISWSTVA